MKYLGGFFCAAVFLTVQILTLSHYGINWDSPTRFLRGQAYLEFFLTGKKTFGFQRSLSPMIVHDNEIVSRFDHLEGEGAVQAKLPSNPLYLRQFQDLQKKLGKRISFYEDDYYNGNYFMRADSGHPPFPDIIAAVSNRIFYQWLNLVDDIHAYQLADGLFGAIGVFVIFVFTYEILEYIGFSGIGVLIGSVISAMSLSLFPLYFGDSHFNMKEPLVAGLYAGAIWTFWKWFRTNKTHWFIGLMAFVAVSLATKWNVILLPLVLTPWVILQVKSDEFKQWFKIKKLALFLIIGLVACVLFVIIVWPYTWSDPFGRLYQTFIYYKDFITRSAPMDQPPGYIWLFGFNLFPMFLILTESPGVILLLALLGTVGLLAKPKARNTGMLLLLWFFIPVLKMSWPGVWFYNGMRQEIEAIPALAVLSGIGFAWISSLILNHLRHPERLTCRQAESEGSSQEDSSPSVQNDNRRILLIVGAFIMIIFLLIYPIIHLFPNENLYFNSLVGGERGAFQKNLIDQKKNYGNIYKQAAVWLNKHAVKNAKIAILSGNEFAMAPEFLRPDMSISPYNFSGFDQKGEYAVEVFEYGLSQNFSYKYLYRFTNPLYTAYLDGAPIFKIFRNSDDAKRIDTNKEIITDKFDLKVNNASMGKQINIDLGQTVGVTKIYIDSKSKDCHKISFRYGDEAISFYSDNGVGNDIYKFNEKTDLGNGRVMFSFPAVPARFIAIEPVNDYSCFARGTVSAVSFLP